MGEILCWILFCFHWKCWPTVAPAGSWAEAEGRPPVYIFIGRALILLGNLLDEPEVYKSPWPLLRPAAFTARSLWESFFLS